MNNGLGEIIKFKYPDEYKSGAVEVRQDHPSEDMYISNWTVADPLPDQATLDTWDAELDVDKAEKAAKQNNREQATSRLKNPMPTNSVPELRNMVDDILSYLELD